MYSKGIPFTSFASNVNRKICFYHLILAVRRIDYITIHFTYYIVKLASPQQAKKEPLAMPKAPSSLFAIFYSFAGYAFSPFSVGYVFASQHDGEE